MTLAIVGKKPWKANKFGAVKVKTDEGTFDSKREYQRWCVLKLMQKAGVISGLKRQVPYDLNVNGEHVCKIVVDFTYAHRDTGFTLEDAKGFQTPESKLKYKLFAAIFGQEIKLS